MSLRPGAELKLPAWVERLDRLPEEATQQALSTARDFLREETQRNARKGGPRGLRVRTGALLRSIRTYLKATDADTWELSLGMKFYGWVHDTGMTIRAKNAPYLRFRTPDGSWHSVKEVFLPERRWARDAMDATVERFPGYLRQALRRAQA